MHALEVHIGVYAFLVCVGSYFFLVNGAAVSDHFGREKLAVSPARISLYEFMI